MKLKSVIRKTHKWIGLVIALYLVIQSLTGVMLIYRGEIETLVARDDLVVGVSAAPSSIGQVIDNLEDRFVGYEINRIYFPETSGGFYRAHIKSPDGATSEVVEVGQFTATAYGSGWTMDFYDLILKWHHELALGQSGAYVVGLVGLLFAISTILGFWLWWPGWRKIPVALRIRQISTGIRDLYDFHRATGAICAIVMLVTATSGFALAYAGPLRSALVVNGVSPSSIKKSIDGSVITADELLMIAQSAMPDARVRDIRFTQPGNLLSTVVFFRDTPTGAGPFHRVWIDPFSGDIRGVADSRELGFINSVLDWMYPLHTELGLAVVGKLVLTISGLGVLILSLTGPLLWWKKRRLRRRPVGQGGPAQVMR